MEPLRRKYIYLIFGIVLMTLAFVIDCYTTLGNYDGLLYLPVILLTLFLSETLFTVMTGLLSSVLLIVGFYVNPYSDKSIDGLDLAHILSLFFILITVLLIYLYKRSKAETYFYQEKLKVIIQHAEEGMLIISADEKIVMMNPKIMELFGYSESELIGEKLYFLLPSGFNANEFENKSGDIQKKYELKQEKEIIFNAKRKDGSFFPVAAHKWSFTISSRKYFIYFLLDITERAKQKDELNNVHNELKKYSKELEKANSILESNVEDRTAELTKTVNELEMSNKRLQQEIMNKEEAVMALKESQVMMETIAVNYPNGILSVMNRDFRLIYAQGKELEKIGFTREELIGNLFLPLRNKATEQSVKEILLKAFNGEKVSFEYQNPDSKDYYLFHGAPLINSIKEITQVLVVSQNITSLKKAEFEMRKTLERERELNELKSRFVSTASHEFRTPLAAILSSASLISMYNGSEDESKRMKHVGRIASSVNNLTEILNDFLSLGKIEEGKVSNQPAEFNIKELCEEILEDIKVLAKPGQEIKINYSIDGSLVMLDKQLLRNILLNLLSNAVKYSAENTAIYLDVLKVKRQLHFSVKDQGIGIPETDQKHLFETFFRASNVENIKGTGMGLHIVKKYLDIMNGRIAFESKVNEGSKFITTFEI